jgi:DNA-binding SARP family transcriptional activator/streptogramin lyase
LGVEFLILGPLEVLNDGNAVQLGSRMQRAVLAVLLLRANEVTSTDRLIEDLWPDHAPPTALKTLRAYVSRLRRALDDDGSHQLRTVGSGYRLEVTPDALDRDRFEHLVADARQARDRGEASELLTSALSLWRGPMLADLAYEPFAQAEITRLEELRLLAIEERIEADIELGRHAGVVGELRSLLGEHPFRERLWAALMLALYRSGRQAEALEVYREARGTLVEELGLEPGPALRAIEASILRQDSSLQLAAAPRDVVVEERTFVPREPPRGIRGPIAAAAALGVLVAAIAVFALARGDDAPAGPPSPTSPPTGVVPDETPPPGSLANVDPDTGAVSLTVPDVTGLGPTRRIDPTIGVGAGGIWVYSFAPGDSHTSFVLHVDPATGEHVTIPVRAIFETGAALAVASQTVWFIGEAEPTRVSRINAATDQYLEPVSIRSGVATDIVLGEGSLWVGSNAGTINEFDPLTGERISEIELAASPDELAFGAGFLWALDQIGGHVIQIDPEDGRVVRRIDVIGNLEDIAAGDGGVWVLDDFAGTVTQIDPETGALQNPIGVGPMPTAIVVGLGSAWITDSEDGLISRVDPRLGSQEPIDVGVPLVAVAVDEETNSLWVAVLDTEV